MNNIIMQLQKFSVFLIMVSVICSYSVKADSIDVSRNLIEELKANKIDLSGPNRFVEVDHYSVFDEADYIRGYFNFEIFNRNYSYSTSAVKDYDHVDSAFFNTLLRIPRDVEFIKSSSGNLSKASSSLFFVKSPFSVTLVFGLGNQFIKEIEGNFVEDWFSYFTRNSNSRRPDSKNYSKAFERALSRSGTSKGKASELLASSVKKLGEYDNLTLFKKIFSADSADFKKDLSVVDNIELASLLCLRDIAPFKSDSDIHFFDTKELTVYYCYWYKSMPDNIHSYILMAFEPDGRLCWTGNLGVEMNKVKDKKEIDDFMVTTFRAVDPAKKKYKETFPKLEIPEEFWNP